jgi:hypothetical protein
MPLYIRPLPVAGMARRITVVAREKELGALPAAFAALTRDTLIAQIGAQMGQTGLGAIQPEDVET